MPSGPSPSVPPRAFPFTQPSFPYISDTSSSSETTSDDEDFETPFSKMSFEEFERFQKAKTEALEKFYNDLGNAASRAYSSSAPPPATSKPQEAPRPSRPSAASSSVPPPEPLRQPPPPELAPELVSEELPDHAEIMREKESKQRCAHLRYLIERHKKINEQYPPLPSQILSKDGEEECDNDEDDDEALYDLVCLRKIVYKLNSLIHSNDAHVF